jgi:wax ester synthase-like acyl-CoA acyltransferase family protein/universal stress protein family protein
VTTDLIEGTTAHGLSDASAQAFEVVLGHRGLGGFGSLPLGSTGLRVAAHAFGPVVIVRGEDIAPAAAKDVCSWAPTSSEASAVALEFRADRRFVRGMCVFIGGLARSVLRLSLHAAPCLCRPIGRHRRWSWIQVDLDQVKAVRRALSGTVNDVILAVVTRGFVTGLAWRTHRPDVRMPAGPVSVRAGDACHPVHPQVVTGFRFIDGEGPDPA